MKNLIEIINQNLKEKGIDPSEEIKNDDLISILENLVYIKK